ncbi:hypothetical protein EI427_01200 [Flammeovirga pectinis]|uniref:Uncharacterized protein n=1 Tax=Flammeovirga pectinis TaxID=2494373 RepID=A0A3S9NYD2_9BACT|nr:hypothetical protein [Flammeovirga pectinis]AZQ60875.1 hypothetical protein EI427_01200 [Flammeovirga pectinis]
MKKLILSSLLFITTLLTLQAQSIETGVGKLQYLKDHNAFISETTIEDINKDNTADVAYSYSYNAKKGLMTIKVISKPEFAKYAEVAASKAYIPLVEEYGINLSECTREAYDYDVKYEVTITMPINKSKVNINQNDIYIAK